MTPDQMERLITILDRIATTMEKDRDRGPARTGKARRRKPANDVKEAARKAAELAGGEPDEVSRQRARRTLERLGIR